MIEKGMEHREFGDGKAIQAAPVGGVPNPGDPEPKRAPRRLVVALQPAQADQLRRVSEQTGIPQAELLAGIERDPAFGAMVTAWLRGRFKVWKESLADSQIFPEER